MKVWTVRHIVEAQSVAQLGVFEAEAETVEVRGDGTYLTFHGRRFIDADTGVIVRYTKLNHKWAFDDRVAALEYALSEMNKEAREIYACADVEVKRLEGLCRDAGVDPIAALMKSKAEEEQKK